MATSGIKLSIAARLVGIPVRAFLFGVFPFAQSGQYEPGARATGCRGTHRWRLVTDEIYRKMSASEQTYWHDHKYEVDAGLLKSLTQSGAEEAATLAKVRTL